LRGWFDRVIGVVRRSWVPLMIIQFGGAMVGALISYTLTPNLPAGPAAGARLDGFDGFIAVLGLAIVICVGVFAQGMSVYVAIRDAAGRPVTTERAIQFASRRAPALLGWGLVAGMLTGVGLLMLFVPGIYLAIVFGATLAGVVTVERTGIQRCFELVNRRFWPTAERMVIALVAAAGYSVLSDFVVRALSQPGSFNEAVLQAVMAVPLGMAAVGVVVVTYAELRFHHSSGVLTSTLADELDR
jgi:hypothetical protein